MCDTKELVAKSSRAWRKGQRVSFEVMAPCETSQFLEFPLGPDGERSISENSRITTLIIRRKPQYKDVTIRTYHWRRTLVPPLDRVVIEKNGELMPNISIGWTRTTSCFFPVSAAQSKLLTFGTAEPLMSNTFELSVPLSFMNPGDEYKIAFHYRSS